MIFPYPWKIAFALSQKHVKIAFQVVPVEQAEGVGMTRRTTTWMKWVRGAGLLLAMGCGPQEGPLAPEGPGPEHQLMARGLMASPDATLRVPRCQAGGSDRDSGTLLQGRAGLGPEQNAPNTLGGTCADGTSGSYRSDESVEQVRVVTVDGSTLAAGKQVRVEVVVWAYCV